MNKTIIENNAQTVRIGNAPIKPVSLSEKAKGIVEAQIKNAALEGLKSMRAFNVAHAEGFAVELSYIFPQILTTLFPELKFRQLCPIVRGQSWDKLVLTRLYDFTGEAKISDQLAGDDPVIDVAGLEQVDKIYDINIGARWSVSEMMSEIASSRIQPVKLRAVKRAHEQKLNNMFYFGDASYNINGILTDTTIPRDTISTPWSDSGKTLDQKMLDILDAINTMNSTSNGIFRTKKIVMSLDKFNSIFGNPRSDFVNQDVYRTIMENFASVGLESIEGDAYLNGQGDDDTGVMILLDKNEENYYMNIPLEMMALPMFQKGSRIDFPFMSRSTGLIVVRSPSINIVDGL